MRRTQIFLLHIPFVNRSFFLHRLRYFILSSFSFSLSLSPSVSLSLSHSLSFWFWQKEWLRERERVMKEEGGGRWDFIRSFTSLWFMKHFIACIFHPAESGLHHLFLLPFSLFSLSLFLSLLSPFLFTGLALSPLFPSLPRTSFLSQSLLLSLPFLPQSLSRSLFSLSLPSLPPFLSSSLLRLSSHLVDWWLS